MLMLSYHLAMIIHCNVIVYYTKFFFSAACALERVINLSLCAGMRHVTLTGTLGRWRTVQSHKVAQDQRGINIYGLFIRETDAGGIHSG